jgi:hypothetical protein
VLRLGMEVFSNSMASCHNFQLTKPCSRVRNRMRNAEYPASVMRRCTKPLHRDANIGNKAPARLVLHTAASG